MKTLLATLAITATLALPAAAQDRLSLMLDWFVNPDHGPIILAQELGYFRDAGLESRSSPRPTPTRRRAWWRRAASIWRSAISPNCT